MEKVIVRYNKVVKKQPTNNNINMRNIAVIIILFIFNTSNINAQASPSCIEGSNVVQIATGNHHSLFLTNDGYVYSVGNNYTGQLGDGTSGSGTDKNKPVKVNNDGGFINGTVKQIAGGNNHNLFLTNDGYVYSVGRNDSGQLGDGSTTNRSTPVKVENNGSFINGEVKQIAAGEWHSLFITNDGNVYSVGWNYDGQLGDGSTTNRSKPVKVENNGNFINGDVKQIAGGGRHSLFLINDGNVYSVGQNSYGGLGDGTTTDRKKPVKVENNGNFVNGNVKQIAAGAGHSLFLTDDGNVYSVGQNFSGQLGDGTSGFGTHRKKPVKVENNGNFVNGEVKQIAAGEWHSLFITNDGNVYSVGRNQYGQLGDGTSGFGTHRKKPVKVENNGNFINGNVKQIAGGEQHSLFLTNDGIVYSVGYNGYGQLGDGTTSHRKKPVKVIR